ncbi:hypothetical protein [Bosea rubneri]|uniref:Uncharacterized protein n=1 Tax=Bosea rubneri TaxID=3075434 RepID=A0ABU3SF22_9HYPH|nr:hypothetical protein [Bosea sp. ZW T0_25]MDU0342990.1 hypothetical protein [Bosea sp. ZW T0_25]
MKILDPEVPPTEPFEPRYAQMQARLVAAGCEGDVFRSVPLLASFDAMREAVDEFLESGATDVILDITSMPKRWFFPLTKMLLASEQVSSLVATYTSALKYSNNLSSNPEPLSAIPGFASDDARLEHDTAIVGIGFEPLGLNELYSQQKVNKIRYVFPFPPGPPGFHRNWAFVRQLEAPISEQGNDRRWHISMYDCSSVFDALVEVSGNGNSTCVLAPYGPKTVSLAMCLFSIALQRANLASAPVYYAQPKRYDLNYSSGIKMIGGKSDIQAYCLKLRGENLFSL